MFIRIYDDQTTNDEYIVNTDNICCIRYYTKQSGLKESNAKSSISYFLDIYFINNNQLTFNFKDNEIWYYYIDQFKKLIKEAKGEEQDEGLQQNRK